jgi:exodeoxyribonuclease VII large subunit
MMLQDFALASAKEEVISVSQLNKLARTALENTLPIMWIKGEVSGLRSYAHIYFDLKDETAKISCVFFSNLAKLLDFTLENGTKVEVRGRVTIYPANGSYQINVERIRKVGLGELWEAYARLINKLRDEGLFAAKFKKELPQLPRAIGVITSKDGAVIRDVVTTLKRRMPSIPIIIYHSAVQGNDATMQLVRAIRTANQRNEVEVLIICRGGGSMEDLWCFNEEAVAREAFASRIPLISAVGHETDTSIIDFVADLRAPTPTAAAELVVKGRNEWLGDLERLRLSLYNQIYRLYNEQQQRLDLLHSRLRAAQPQSRVVVYRQILNQFAHKLEQAMLQKTTDLSWKLLNYQNRLELLNPHNVLNRGYAIIHNAQGKIIQSVSQTSSHSRINLIVADGTISAVVE